MTALDVLELPFDQFQRYRLVADLLARVADGGRLEVLDVGGRTGLLREFLSKVGLDASVTLVDVEESDVPGLILGSGHQLPFQDESFDAVCAFDTLEHVPPAGREAFVRECARTSRGWVFLAGPYKAPEVDEAEELLQSFLKDKLDLEHRYLAEHRSNGLPVRADTEGWLAAEGMSVESFGHGNLERWLVLMCIEMYLDADPMLRPLARRFFRFYNEALYAADHAEPVYRHIVAGARSGRAMPDLDGLLDPPRMPRGVWSGVTVFAAELLSFDQKRDAWAPEIARLEGIVTDLEKDLLGHKTRISDKERDLAMTEASLAEARGIIERTKVDAEHEKAMLEADVGHAKETIEALREEQAAALERQHEERERAAQEIAQRDDERAALSGKLEKALEAVDDLKNKLREAEDGAGSIQEELRVARAECDEMGRHIAHMDGEIASLRGMLRDRQGNLKRAFGKKLTFE